MSTAAINLTNFKTKHHHHPSDDRKHSRIHERTKDEGIQVELGSESVSRKGRTVEVATQTDEGWTAATGQGSFSAVVSSFHMSRTRKGKAKRQRSDSELSSITSSKESTLRSWHEFKLPWRSGHSKQLTSEKESTETRKDADEPLPASNHISWTVDRPVRLDMSHTRLLSETPVTVMTMMKDVVARNSNRLALAFWTKTNWMEVTYQVFLDGITKAARGFIKLGLKALHGVGIMSDNSIEYLIAFFGVIFAGGICCPLYVNNASEFSFLLMKDVRCQFLVVDAIMLRRHVLNWRMRLPQLIAIVQVDVRTYLKEENVYLWSEFLEIGNEVSNEFLGFRILQQAPNVCCCIFQTAGSSGNPKNVLISHDNLVWTALVSGRSTALSDGRGVVVHFLSFASLTSLRLALSVLITGSALHLLSCASNEELLLDALTEIRPTLMMANARHYEALQLAMEAHCPKTPLRQLSFRWAKNVAMQRLRNSILQDSHPTCWSFCNNLYFKRFQKAVGLDRCSELLAEGIPLFQRTSEFFLSLDMPIKTIYGLTESTGVHTMATLNRYKVGSIGVPLDGCIVAVKEQDSKGVGTLRLSGRNIAMGYLNMEELTKSSFDDASAAFDSDDFGHVDKDGFVHYVGSKHDFVTLSTGEKIMTVPLQMKIRERLPFVSYALIVGEGKTHLGAILTPKTEVDRQTFQRTNRLSADAVRWFRLNGFDIISGADIAAKGGLRISHRIQRVFNSINSQAAHESYKIKRWVLEVNDFSPGAEELGPTMKMKRWFLTKKYAVAIASMFPVESLERKSIFNALSE